MSGFQVDKIYTRSGDRGLTRLIGGGRVPKSDLQVECYGTMDELNASIGVVRTMALDYKEKMPIIAEFSEEVFKKIQNDLFDLGSVLATARRKPTGEFSKEGESLSHAPDKTLDNGRTLFLEEKIDWMNDRLEPIRSFVLPGGGKLNAFSHVARTVCRRLERILVGWGGLEDERDFVILAYVNRLSDFLFAYSRWVSKELEEPEFLWETPLLHEKKREEKKKKN